MKQRSALITALVLLGVVGCGGQQTAPVSGQVTLDGAPLVNATVIFQPDSNLPNPGPGSYATTDAKGHYSLKLNSGDAPGAILGKHKVRITAYDGDDVVPSSGSDIVFRKARVPDDYNASSKLTFEVTAEGSKNADFPLKSKK